MSGIKYQKREQLHHIDPLALLALGRVYEFGGRKYDAYNYLRGYDFSLSYDALMRHMLEFWSGNDLDDESGELHVLHAAFHCLSLASFILRGVGHDDRPPRPSEAAVELPVGASVTELHEWFTKDAEPGERYEWCELCIPESENQLAYYCERHYRDYFQGSA
jgi:hypothetical protein